MKICKSVSRPRRQVWSSKRHNTQLDKTDYSRCMAPIYPNMVYVLLNVHMVKRELMQCFTLLILLVWLTHLLSTLFSGATLHSQYQLGQYYYRTTITFSCCTLIALVEMANMMGNTILSLILMYHLLYTHYGNAQYTSKMTLGRNVVT